MKPATRLDSPQAKGTQRPRGLPTSTDRVAQAIGKHALAPRGEARVEATRDGVRPGRRGHAAIAHCHTRLRQGREGWSRDAEIRGAFDHSSHAGMLNALGHTPGRARVTRWLNAGDGAAERCHDTRRGTPQGGSVSPWVAHLARDGLEARLATHRTGKAYADTARKGRHKGSRQGSHRYGGIRDADDRLVTAGTTEEIDAMVPTLETW